MRIIAGEAKGRTIVAPKGDETRPTSDKIRDALFSILQFDVPGARVLDLFGGTGALALEAISRGAESAVICDVSQDAAKAVSRNIETVCGRDGRARFVKADYRKALDALRNEKFSLVFLDPPYRMTEAYTAAVAFILNNNMLTEDGIIIAERQKGAEYTLPDTVLIRDTRTYRDTQLDFIVRR